MFLNRTVEKCFIKLGAPEAIAKAAVLGAETWPADCEDAIKLIPDYLICDWCGRFHRSIDHDRKSAHFINDELLLIKSGEITKA